MSTTKPETLTIRRSERNMVVAIAALSAVIVIAASVAAGFILGNHYSNHYSSSVRSEAATYAKQIVEKAQLKP